MVIVEWIRAHKVWSGVIAFLAVLGIIGAATGGSKAPQARTTAPPPAQQAVATSVPTRTPAPATKAGDCIRNGLTSLRQGIRDTLVDGATLGPITAVQDTDHPHAYVVAGMLGGAAPTPGLGLWSTDQLDPATNGGIISWQNDAARAASYSPLNARPLLDPESKAISTVERCAAS